MCFSGWCGSALWSVSAYGGAVVTAAATDGGRSALVRAGGETTGTDPTHLHLLTCICSSLFPFPSPLSPCLAVLQGC